jgi:hypothetical protein
MNALHLSTDLAFPADIVTRKTVVYGGNGMGKTNLTLGVLPEELHARGLRFCILDPMGVAWGVQHGGKRGTKGLDVLILGGPHGDVEITPTSGAVVADLVADEAVSTVVDVSRTKAGKGWSKGEKIRFVADFCLRLHERQAETRRPLLVIMDEAARFIPQMIPHGAPDLARCVGAVEMLAEEGRNIGVGMVFITPRSARMNKSVSELADTMVAFRTVGPNSVGAVMDWLGEHVEKERHKGLVAALRTLPVGSALVVSPGWLQHEGVVRFRARHTFDSSKTPEVGAAVVAPGAAAKPDLAKYRARMAATIEQAKADDPKALRRRVAELEDAVKKASTRRFASVETAVLPKRVEVPVLKEAELARAEKVVLRAHDLVSAVASRFVKDLLPVLQTINSRLDAHRGLKVLTPGEVKRALGPTPARAPSALERDLVKGGGVPLPATLIRKVAHDLGRESPLKGDLPRGQQAVLDGLAQLAAWGIGAPTKKQTALMAGQSPNSGSYNKNLATLHAAGLITYPNLGLVGLTAAGQEKAQAAAAPASPEAMQASVYARLPDGQRRILAFLVAQHPEAHTKAVLAQAVGQSSNSGSYNKNLAELHTLGVVEYPSKGFVRAADVMFPGRPA